MKIFTLLFSLELVCGLDVFLLNNDQAEHEGYLSYYTGGRWNFLCTAFWDNRNSKVVCRQLGFSKVSANQTRFDLNKAEDTGVWEKYLHCEGHEESLDECRRENIKWNVYKRVCSNVEHRVFLRCSKQRDDDILTSKGQTLRLWDSSGKLVSSGVLQHMEDGRWKNVCAVGWDEANSHVACSVLGYTTSISRHTEVPGKEVTEELTSAAYFRCKGFETSLWECEKATAESCEGAVELNCVTKHPKKVGKDVRLRGSTLPGEGRVEVWNGRAWGTVCDDAWDLKDAHVVCKQLGYGSAREATHWATQGQGLGPIVFTEAACLGNETSLLECTRKANGNDCTHAEDAGVKCHIPKLLHQDVRVVGGKKLSEGRIEVSFDSGVSWGSICGIGFTETEGQIVCRQLGYGYAKWADRSYKYGVLYRKLMYNVRCNGSETSIKDCHYNRHGRCRYYDMASVICSQHAPDLVMDMSTFRDSIKVESHALRELRCSFEENCLAPVVDRMFFYRNRWSKRHLLKFTSRFMNKGSADFRPNQHKDSWEWHSCHKHYHSMETFAVYDIIDKDARAVAEGHKASFCLEDSECEQGFNKMYNCTNKGDQGVSVNCADNYKNTIDCQWIDITDLKEGNYSLRVVVNPSRGIIETDYHNNHATCQLSYHANRTVSVHECATGERVTGKVIVSIKKVIKIRGIHLKVQGIAKCHWEKGGTQEKVVYHDKDELLSMEEWLHGDGDGVFQQDPGRYTFPFACHLPSELPSSFEGRNGSIRYHIRAEIVKFVKPNLWRELKLTVNELIDTNLAEYALEQPVGETTSEVMSGYCCPEGSGELYLKASIERAAYCSGEAITVKVHIDNRSPENFGPLYFLLKQIVEYGGKKRTWMEEYSAKTKTKTNERLIAEFLGIPAIPGRYNRSGKQVMHVPNIAPTNLISSVLKVHYKLKLKLNRASPLDPEIAVNIPVVIGTIPFTQVDSLMKQQPLPGSGDDGLVTVDLTSQAERASNLTSSDDGLVTVDLTSQAERASNLSSTHEYLNTAPPSYEDVVTHTMKNDEGFHIYNPEISQQTTPHNEEGVITEQPPPYTLEAI